jgi:hypothetical protein
MFASKTACKSVLLAVLVLVLLLVATATGAAVNQTNCDRYRSRKAQVVVQDYIVPRAEKLGYTLPQTCLVHPQRNMCAAHFPPARVLVHNHRHALTHGGVSTPCLLSAYCPDLTAVGCFRPADIRCKRRSALSCSADSGSAASAARRCGDRTIWTPTWLSSTRISSSRQGTVLTSVYNWDLGYVWG